MHAKVWWSGALIAALAFSCGAPPPKPPGDVPVEDAGVVEPPDAGQQPADSGPPDAGPPDAGSPDAGPPDAGSEPLSLEISSGTLIPAFARGITSYEVSSFTRLQPVSITVRGADTAEYDGRRLTNGVPHLLPNLAITAGAHIDVIIDDVAYSISLRPADLPAYTTVVNGPTPGQLFFTAGPYLLVTDEHGEILFFRSVGSQPFDFKRHHLDGGVVRHSYLYDGEAYVLDAQFKPVASYRLLATPTHPAHEHGMHDFEVLGNDHVLMQAHIEKTVFNIPAHVPHSDGGVEVVAGVVQEVKNGTVIFEWDSTDHPQLYELSTQGNDFTSGRANYAHLNSVEVDRWDQNLVLSFRHLDAVLKVDRVTGAILWRLGNVNDDFGTTPAQRPSHQHTAQMITPNTLILFDNGNATQSSRVLTYGLDVPGHSLVWFDSLELGYYTSAMGSVQALTGEVYLVGLGLHQLGTPDILEINRATGAETFRLTLPFFVRNYRAFKYP